jgi:hypothetical protein
MLVNRSFRVYMLGEASYGSLYASSPRMEQLGAIKVAKMQGMFGHYRCLLKEAASLVSHRVGTTSLK